MERNRFFALAAVALLVIPLALSYMNSFGFWTLTFIIVIVGLLFLGLLFPRPKEPEVRGEDVYHLHP